MSKAQFINFIGRVPLISTLLRWVAHRYEEGSVVAIRSGCAQGLFWRRHHRYVNGYWIGQYELPVQHALSRELNAGDTFFDVGANAGFFSLVAWKLVGANGRVASVDPDPVNIEAIEEQVSLNHAKNWQTFQMAVSDHPGTAQFSRSAPGSPKGRLGMVKGAEVFEVKLSTLDDLVETAGPPSFIKLDVEGAEVAVLRGAHRLLMEYSPKWLIELHGPECERGVREILTELGYHFFSVSGIPVEQTGPLPHHVIAIKKN